MNLAVVPLLYTAGAALAAWSLVVCGSKGKFGTILVGFVLYASATFRRAGSIHVPTASQYLIAELFLLLVWTIGATRLARPTSVWARSLYDESRFGDAAARFTRRGQAAPQPPTPGRPHLSVAGRQAIGLVALAGLLGYPVLAMALTCAATAPLVVLAAAGSRPSRFAAAAIAILGTVLSLAYTVDWTRSGVRTVFAVLSALVLAAGLARLATDSRTPGAP